MCELASVLELCLEVRERVLHAWLEDFRAFVDGVHFGVALDDLVDVDVEAVSGALPDFLMPCGLDGLVVGAELEGVDGNEPLSFCAHTTASFPSHTNANPIIAPTAHHHTSPPFTLQHSQCKQQKENW
jgi:hypothetical protein